MKLRYALAGHGAGDFAVASAEEAVGVLATELRRIAAGLPLGQAAVFLTNTMGPCRHAMLTEGQRSAERGIPWSYSAGGLFVELLP